MIKELTFVNSSSDRVVTYKFKAPYDLEELHMSIRRFNTLFDCNWNDGKIPYSELVTLLRRETSSAHKIYSFGCQNSEFISRLIHRPVTDIFELENSGLMHLLCKFTCHYMFIHVS
jgi:glycyl-tRNA synthetase alpha subunit